jgi:hypothetical protein
VIVMKSIALAAGALLALAFGTSGALAQETPRPVASITVQADVTAIANAEAAEFWRGIATDLEDALVRELAGTMSPEGLALLVVIDELALEQAFAAGMAGDARLVGRAQLVDQADGDRIEATYEIAASAQEMEALFPEGVEVETISRTSAEFYQVVIDAFARGVADTVLGRI